MPRTARATVHLLPALLLPALLSGCTAAYGGYAIESASRAYQQALAAGAEESAPYQVTLAWEYLQKAREEAGYSDYGAVDQLCQRSKEASWKAKELADQGVVPTSNPTDLPESLWSRDPSSSSSTSTTGGGDVP